MQSLIRQLFVNDPVWTLFPGSKGNIEVLLALGFIVLSLLLLKLTRSRNLMWLIALSYLFGLLFLTLFTRTPGPNRISLLVPFTTIRNALDWQDGGLRVIDYMNLYALIGNVLLFVPFGYLLPKAFPKTAKFYLTIPAGLLASLAIETTQYITKLGCFDVDDLIANTIGAAIGYLLFLLVLRGRKKR